MKNILYIFGFMAVIIMIQSCQEELAPVSCDGSTPTYDSEIINIFTSSCSTTASCHGAGASSGRGEFLTYEDLMDDIANGELEKQVITKQRMPRNGSLTQEELTLFQCWIENGYPEN